MAAITQPSTLGAADVEKLYSAVWRFVVRVVIEMMMVIWDNDDDDDAENDFADDHWDADGDDLMWMRVVMLSLSGASDCGEHCRLIFALFFFDIFNMYILLYIGC